jgi:5'-AMP-activated protein kinase catalytic alpha subunit
MSLKRIDNKLILYSSSSRQRRNTISPNIEKNKKIGDYLLLSTIGRGTFSKVKLGLHLPTKQKVAIKILDKEKINDEADIERIRREIHILSILRHPNIVQLYETINSDNTIYIIMEYIEGKDLFQYIYSMQHLTEYKSSQLFRQLISCLEYIHKLGIVHRDIKPENILLNKNKKILKLVDF